MSAKTCVVTGCDRPIKVVSRGLCHKHYMRWQRHGDPSIVLSSKTKGIRPGTNGGCPIANCRGPIHALGLCVSHYRRWAKHGDPFWDGTPIVCLVQECLHKPKGRGWCQFHYDRWRRYGDPLGGPSRVVPMRVYLPLPPLLDFISDRGGIAAAIARAGDGYGYQEPGRERVEAAIGRAVERGEIDLAAADDICCNALQIHPALIWPEDYWTATKREDIDDSPEEGEAWQEAA